MAEQLTQQERPPSGAQPQLPRCHTLVRKAELLVQQERSLLSAPLLPSRHHTCARDRGADPNQQEPPPSSAPPCLRAATHGRARQNC